MFEACSLMLSVAAWRITLFEEFEILLGEIEAALVKWLIYFLSRTASENGRYCHRLIEAAGNV